MTADLELTYGDVTVPTPGAVRLVSRPAPMADWTNRNGEATITGTTATLNGQTSFGEYGLSEPAIYHVNAAAAESGDGTSFENAFPDLQEALDRAQSHDVIVIAAGTYVPTSDPGNRDARFEITGAQDGLKIYGGWPDTTSFGNIAEIDEALSGRDLGENLTVLSGDIDNNDAKTNGITEDAADIIGANSKTVVYLDGRAGGNITTDTVLDGLVITGGQVAAAVVPKLHAVVVYIVEAIASKTDVAP